MVITIEKKIRTTLLLFVMLLAWVVPFPLVSEGFAQPKTSAPTFSWQETTYDYSLHRDWDGISTVINYSGSYSDVFNTNTGFYNETDQTWIEEVRTHDYSANYSFFSNATKKGYIDINMSLDVYRVDVQYGDAVDLIWMALKQGTLEMDTLLEQLEKDYSYFEEYYTDIESEFTKYNLTTWEVIETWTGTFNETGEHNMTRDGDLINYNNFYAYDLEFSLPLILTMQVYTTAKKDKIGWADSFWEFIVYKDIDQNNIYSAGKTSNPPTSGFSIYSSDEMCGFVRPMAWDYQYYQEITYPAPSNATMYFNIPFDKSVSEIASTIQFTPPNISTDNIISWDVEYPQFPIYTSIYDDDKDPSEAYYTPTNATQAQMSPGDFNYHFDYNLSESKADFDFTLSLPKITNEDFYNATQGYGLSLPHYNFFVTSFDINEVDPVELTVPSDLFTFESNGTTVAEINMINPVKKNYTLYNYPELGIDTSMESTGGSLHRLLLEDSKQSDNAGNPFINLIYTIKDIAEADPTFTIADDLYHVETQNYPVWNGEKLVHDPTFTIYYDPQVAPPDEPTPTPTPTPTPATIPGFSTLLVGAVSTIVISAKVAKKKKKIKHT